MPSRNLDRTRLLTDGLLGAQGRDRIEQTARNGVARIVRKKCLLREEIAAVNLNETDAIHRNVSLPVVAIGNARYLPIGEFLRRSGRRANSALAAFGVALNLEFSSDALTPTRPIRNNCAQTGVEYPVMTSSFRK
jgi:hypothetical protein